MLAFDFDKLSRDELENRLGDLARLLGRYLSAALKKTRTLKGEYPLTTAVKLISGRGKLTATQAADMVKRMLLQIDADAVEELLDADSVLKDALDRARATRASKKKP